MLGGLAGPGGQTNFAFASGCCDGLDTDPAYHGCSSLQLGLTTINTIADGAGILCL